MTKKDVINKADFLEIYSSKLDISKAKAADCLNSFLDTITEQLANGTKVVFTGYLAFDVVRRKERTGHNPRTGDKIKIPARETVRVKLGKTLIEAATKNKKK